MNLLKAVGVPVLRKWRSACGITAMAWAAVLLAVRPACWPRTTRTQLGRQILFTGVEALGLTLLIAVLAGISVVAQTQLWLSRLGQSAILGEVLVTVIIRGVGPIFVSFLVISRSGTAIATELANMSVLGEVKILDSQGIDPVPYLVMPRVVAMAVSVFCLTVIFVAVSLGTGYILGSLFGIAPADPRLFSDSVFLAITPGDLPGFAAKTLIPGLAMGAICCVEGLEARRSVTEVPRAATRAVVRSIAAAVLISCVISVLAYL